MLGQLGELPEVVTVENGLGSVPGLSDEVFELLVLVAAGRGEEALSQGFLRKQSSSTV